MRRLPISVAVFVGLLLVGCGGADDGTAEVASPEATPTNVSAPASSAETAARRGTRIHSASSDYGTILFGPHRRAIYVFTKESGRKSRCYGDCASAWPPVLTRGRPRASRGVHSRLLGTTRRRGGRRQVTYAGHPLYYWEGDPPGEVYCQAAVEFGGRWLVIRPSGKAVR